jgi:hypothetical protein
MNWPLALKGALVTVIQWTGGERLPVRFNTKPLALFVGQARATERLLAGAAVMAGACVTVTHEENSEVLFDSSVAVAVTT